MIDTTPCKAITFHSGGILVVEEDFRRRTYCAHCGQGTILTDRCVNCDITFRCFVLKVIGSEHSKRFSLIKEIAEDPTLNHLLPIGFMHGTPGEKLRISTHPMEKH